jgi:CRISPR-associated endonuclease Csn1
VEKKLKNKLINYYSLTENEIDETFHETRFLSSYAPVEKKVMEILLTYIKDGCSYPEALDRAVSEGKFKIDKQPIIYDLLPYCGKILQRSTQKLVGKAFSKQFVKINYKEPDTNKNEKEFDKIVNLVTHKH